MQVLIVTNINNSRMPALRYARAFMGLGHQVRVVDFKSKDLELEGSTCDFVLFDDSGDYEIWPKLKCPTYGLVIDTAIDGGERCKNQTKNLDKVFYAQKKQAVNFPNGIWLPNAHDTIIGGPYRFEWENRPQFAGAVGDFHGRTDRKLFRESLENYFSSPTKNVIHFTNNVPFEKLPEFYRKVSFTINHNAYHDVNLRCFESVGEGSILLLHDNKPDNGIRDLGFEPEVNCLSFYNEEDCIELMSHLLADWYLEKDELKKIAKAGYDLVNGKHTYLHRAKTITAIHEEEERPSAQIFAN